MILREIILIWYLISEPFNKVSISELLDWDEIIASFIIRIKAGSHIDEDLHFSLDGCKSDELNAHSLSR